MFKTKSQHMANDRPPVRGGLRKHFVLQVKFLVSPARKKVWCRLQKPAPSSCRRHYTPSSGPCHLVLIAAGCARSHPPGHAGKTQLNDQRSLSTTKNSRNFRTAGSMLDKTEIRTLLLGGGGFAARVEQTCLTADRSDMSDVAQCHKDFLNILTLRRLMSYIYAAPILDVSRSHTTTQHSR